MYLSFCCKVADHPSVGMTRCCPQNRNCIALVCFLCTGVTIGSSTYCFGLFVVPLAEEFGWSRAQIGISLSLCYVTSSISAPLAGFCLDKFGPKKVLMASLVICAAGYALRTLAAPHSLGAFYAASAFGWLGYLGASTLPVGALISVHFPKIKGRMLGLVATGNNFGGFLLTPAAAAFMNNYGWRATNYGFALVQVALVAAVMAFVTDSPARLDEVQEREKEDDTTKITKCSSAKPDKSFKAAGAAQVSPHSPEQIELGDVAVDATEHSKAKLGAEAVAASPRPDLEASANSAESKDSTSTKDTETSASGSESLSCQGLSFSEALRTRAFWCLASGLVLVQYTYSSVQTQLVPHFEAEGISSQKAAVAVSVVATFGALSKIFFGRLSETVPVRHVLALCIAIQIVGCVLLAEVASTEYGVWIAAVVYGFGFGAIGALMAIVLLSAFGLRSFGKLLGVVQLAVVAPGFAGPVVSGGIFDATGHYTLSLWVSAGVFVVALLATELAGKGPKW